MPSRFIVTIKKNKLPVTALGCCLIFLTAGSSNNASVSSIRQLLDSNRSQQGLVEVERLLKKKPQDVTALCLKAQALSQLGQVEEAFAIVERVLKAHPDSAEAHYRKGRLLLALGQQKNALAEIKTANKLKPDWAESRSASAVISFYMGDSESAISDLDIAIKSEPSFASAWGNRGAIYFKLGQFQRAEKDLNRALLLSPNEPETLNNRGRTLHAMKRFEDAIKDFDKAIKLAPKKDDWYNNKGLALVGMGRYEEALPWYTKATELNPKDPSPFGNRGAANLRLKRLTEAEIDLRHALKLDPKYASAHNNLAALLSVKGNIASAKAESDKAVELEPDSKQFHSNRAHILANQGNLDESLFDFQTAKSSEQGEAKPVSTSDFQTLIKTYDRVLRLHPNDTEAYYNRGFAYFCLKDMTAALKDLAIFLRMVSPNSKGALNAAILASFAHRYLGHDVKKSNKPLEEVLKNTPKNLKNYWGWTIASYLAGKTPIASVKALKLNKTSRTQMKCYYAIDRALADDLEGAKREIDWIRVFGDRDIDEYDLTLSWFTRTRVRPDQAKRRPD